MNLSPKIRAQYLLPHLILSRFAGKLANCRVKWLKNFLIKRFCKKYKIDLTESQEQNPADYPDFNSFFTRALKGNARIFPSEQSAIISPADGIISQIGEIDIETTLQAKGLTYELQALLADTPLAKEFQNGKFATIYLAPHNYHRVHMPFKGKLQKMLYVPGKLFSVNQKTANSISELFTKNERVITVFDTDIGKMALVLVGAMLVGNIETVWAGAVNPLHEKAPKIVDYISQNIVLERAAELGRFKFGSTVIVLFAKDAIEWSENTKTSQQVKMGEILGSHL
jgi:phosphatidylserine decarboxylase